MVEQVQRLCLELERLALSDVQPLHNRHVPVVDVRQTPAYCG